MPLMSLMKFLTSLNSISNVFQEPHDFLIFTVNVYISSRSRQPKLPCKKHWRTFSWSGEQPFIDRFLKITEMGFGLLLGTLLCEFLLPERHLLFWLKMNLKFEGYNFDAQYSYNKYCLAFVSCMSPFSLNHALKNRKSN